MARGLLQESSDHLHERRFEISASGQGLSYSPFDELFPCVEPVFLALWLASVAFRPSTAHLLEELCSVFLVTLLRLLVVAISLLLSLLFCRLNKPSALSHSVHNPSPYPSQWFTTGPPPVSRSICCYWWVPKWDRVLQMELHECWVEDNSHFPCSAGDPPVMQSPSLLLPWTLKSFLQSCSPISEAPVWPVAFPSSSDFRRFLHLVRVPLEWSSCSPFMLSNNLPFLQSLNGWNKLN